MASAHLVGALRQLVGVVGLAAAILLKPGFAYASPESEAASVVESAERFGVRFDAPFELTCQWLADRETLNSSQFREVMLANGFAVSLAVTATLDTSQRKVRMTAKRKGVFTKQALLRLVAEAERLATGFGSLAWAFSP